jgi:Flp pilus assembly protein TadD
LHVELVSVKKLTTRTGESSVPEPTDPFATRRLDTNATRDPNVGVAVPSTTCSDVDPTTNVQLDGDWTADVAGYRNLGEIARGGMGVVYRASDLALNRTVAVKVLPERYRGRPAAAARFLEEAQITAQLQHPGIPPVHQVGTLPDGRPFIAMKLIQGRTLAELLADPDWDPGQAISTFEQVCHTVAYAHDHGVIHRDLKPENVMVGRFNEVQVMDWGLARIRTATRDRVAEENAFTVFHDPRAVGSEDCETQAGSVLGTPAYMPPEQAIGAVDRVDERSDVFGLGAILCTILTGKPPYLGADAEATRQLAARARLEDARARLAGCAADPELVALCQRCLSPEQADRPAHAGEVARAVAGLRAAADERTRQAELNRVRAEGERARAEGQAREQRKRRRAQLALVAAVGMLLISAVAFAWEVDRRATQRRTEEEFRERDALDRRQRNADGLAEVLTRCEVALADNDTQRSKELLDEADRRLSEPGGEEWTDRAERCRADLALLRALDQVDAFRWTPSENKFPGDSAVANKLRAALADYGITPGTGPGADAIARTNGSTVRERLLGALDLWLKTEPAPGLTELLQAASRQDGSNVGERLLGGLQLWMRPAPGLTELLHAVDPDPYRDKVRAVLATGKTERQRSLAGEEAALSQPPRFAAVLGQIAAVPADRRRELLKTALAARSDDLSLLMTLGNTFPLSQRGGAEERVRWFQAAVAAHPRTAAAHNNLAGALLDEGDRAGAVAEFREATRLDPDYAAAHNNLGVALAHQGKLVGAVAAYREAIRLDSKFPLAHSNLGIALTNQGDLVGAVATYREAIRLDPNRAFPRYQLARLLGTGPNNICNGKAAVEHATRACELTQWKDSALIDTLAAANAAAGDFDKAVEYEGKALKFPEMAKNQGARDRLELYRQKKAYRDPAFAPTEPGPPARVVKD